MPTLQKTLLPSLLVALSLGLIVACGDGKKSDPQPGGSGGSGGFGGGGGSGGGGGEEGPALEACERPNDGTHPADDREPIADPSGIQIFAAAGPRRGPVSLRFKLPTHGVDPEAVRVELQAGESWQAIAEAGRVICGDEIALVWDSFADVDADGPVTLRVSEGGVATAPFTMALRNDPEVDRLILVGNGSINEGGAAVQKGVHLTAFAWGADGAGIGRKITVGLGPEALSASPDGRAIAVRNATGISLVATPLDADVEGVETIQELALPHGTPQDVRWSRDGRFVYILGTVDGELPSTLWRYELSEGLGAVGAAVSLASFETENGMKMAVDPTNGRLLVGLYDLEQRRPYLILLDTDGNEISREMPGANLSGLLALEIAPGGGYAIGLTRIFGDETHVFRLDGDSIELVQLVTADDGIRAPNGVYFHPSSTRDRAVAVVANFSRNRVTSLVIDDAGVKVGVPAAGFPLSAAMDGIVRGSQAGHVLVPVVLATTTVAQMDLSESGEIELLGTAYDLGSGAENLPDGIAVQR